MIKQRLSTIFKQHDGLVSDKWSSYITNYEKIFRSRRRNVRSLLEIGVQNGGSLEIWCKYFPDLTVALGCDIERKCAHIPFMDPRIEVIVGDVCDPDVLRKIRSKQSTFDVIIDDGSHQSQDIITAFCRLAPALGNNGLYIVEDLHCSYWPKYGGGLHRKDSAIEFFKILCDLLNEAHWSESKSTSDMLREAVAENIFPIGLINRLHSISFFNSMCLVQVGAPGANDLGARVVRGNQEPVKQIRQLIQKS